MSHHNRLFLEPNTKLAQLLSEQDLDTLYYIAINVVLISARYRNYNPTLTKALSQMLNHQTYDEGLTTWELIQVWEAAKEIHANISPPLPSSAEVLQDDHPEIVAAEVEVNSYIAVFFAMKAIMAEERELVLDYTLKAVYHLLESIIDANHQVKVAAVITALCLLNDVSIVYES